MKPRRPALPTSPWKQMAQCRSVEDFLALAARLDAERARLTREIDAHAADIAWQKCEYPNVAARLGDCRDVAQACRERAGRMKGTT